MSQPSEGGSGETAAGRTRPAAEMPIFVRTFDLLTWLLPVTNHFPRAHRHTATSRLLASAFDLRERLEEANLRRGQRRLARLREADEALARLRVYLRLAHRWAWLSEGQYEHVSRQVVEIGRLLGGWMRATAAGRTAHREAST